MTVRPAAGRKPRLRCPVAWSGLAATPAARDLAQRAVEAALARDRLDGRSLTVMLVGDAECRRLHRQHFGIATTTDVMSFPDGVADPEDRRIRLGDLAVCLDEARRVAARRKRPVREELALYVLHGCLHLLGYDDVDPADRAAMWTVQREVMRGLGIDIGSGG